MNNLNRNYKNTVFCMMFKDKERLLTLYNAMNGTHYTNADDLEVNTPEDAIYMNMKNDTVRKAVDECIEEGILEEFLTKNRAEVIDVSILEYDKEKVLRFVREEGFEDGRTLGMTEGKALGMTEGKALGMTEGKALGMTEGKVLGKAELILDLLSDLGNVPKDMKNRIMTEKDAAILSRWNRLAAKSESIGEFEALM